MEVSGLGVGFDASACKCEFSSCREALLGERGLGIPWVYGFGSSCTASQESVKQDFVVCIGLGCNVGAAGMVSGAFMVKLHLNSKIRV